MNLITNLVDVKAAAKISSEYLVSIQDMLESPIQDLSLEEVEVSEDRNHWLITLGYTIKINETKSNLFANSSKDEQLQRKYKIFKVDRQSGEIESMKIRQV